MRSLVKFGSANGWTAEVEPHIRCTDGVLRKPDVLFRRGSEVLVAEVGVNWEAPNPLRMQYDHKVALYSEPRFVEALRARHPNCDIYVRALIIGARGTWCPSNDHLVRQLGLRFKNCQSLVSGVLRGGGPYPPGLWEEGVGRALEGKKFVAPLVMQPSPEAWMEWCLMTVRMVTGPSECVFYCILFYVFYFIL